MPTATERMAKWNARYAEKSMPAVLTGYKPTMSAKLLLVFEDQVQVEQAVKDILAEAAIPTILNPSYHNFARQVRSAMLRFGGGQLLNVVDVYLMKWVARGLDQDILEKIRNTVFALAPPAP